jgi:hypothetical protein
MRQRKDMVHTKLGILIKSCEKELPLYSFVHTCEFTQQIKTEV